MKVDEGMKEMKRIIAGVMSFVMFVIGIGLLPCPVSAAQTADSILEMKTDSKGVNKGDTVEVDFLINGTSTAGFEGYLNYDKSVFDFYASNLVVTTDKPEEDDAVGEWVVSYDPSSQFVSLKWSGTTAVTPKQNAKLLTARFVAKQSVASSTISLQNPVVYKTHTEKMYYPAGLNLAITNSKAKKFTISMENVSGNATISIPVKVTENGGFTSMQLSATYDSQKLFLDSVNLSDNIKSKVTQGAYTISSGGSKVTVPFTSTDTISSTGTLFYLNFKVISASSSSTAGSAANTTSVTVEPEEVTNKNSDFFICNSASSTVFITEADHILGDVNGDNKINLVDALWVICYYNKTKTLASVELTAADVNKNGTVDLVDALMIMQLYNGVIKSFS